MLKAVFCSRDEQQCNNQAEVHGFTSHVTSVLTVFSFSPKLYMVQQSRGFGSSATESVNNFISLSFILSLV